MWPVLCRELVREHSLYNHVFREHYFDKHRVGWLITFACLSRIISTPPPPPRCAETGFGAWLKRIEVLFVLKFVLNFNKKKKYKYSYIFIYFLFSNISNRLKNLKKCSYLSSKLKVSIQNKRRRNV